MLDENQLVFALSQRGHRERHIGDVLAALRPLTRRLQEHRPDLARWEDVTDPELVHVFGVWTAVQDSSGDEA